MRENAIRKEKPRGYAFSAARENQNREKLDAEYATQKTMQNCAKVEKGRKQYEV